jgi:nucleoside 2-deoxyribosyltransferase
MSDYKIYLAGAMAAFGKDEFNKSNNWRVFCKNTLEQCECDYKVKVCNPNDYYSFADETPRYKTDREVMEFDLNKVRNSDLIIVNYNDMRSLGTMSEIAIAYERKIPIIGLDVDNQELHPWQLEMTNRVFSDINEMLDYIEDFYLR